MAGTGAISFDTTKTSSLVKKYQEYAIKTGKTGGNAAIQAYNDIGNYLNGTKSTHC